LGAGEGAFYFERDGRVVVRANDEESVLRYLIREIRGFIFQRTVGELHVHAGAVSLQGVGIMLPGESRSGKSTLTVALLSEGCQYLSDDLAVVKRGTFEIMPTTKAPSLRRPTYALFPEFRDSLLARTCRRLPDAEEKAALPIEMVGEGVLSAPSPLGLIVFPHFREGSELRWQSLGPATAVGRLLRLCHNSRWNTGELIDLAIAVVHSADCFALAFGDVHHAAAWIVQAGRGASVQRSQDKTR